MSEKKMLVNEQKIVKYYTMFTRKLIKKLDMKNE